LHALIPTGTETPIDEADSVEMGLFINAAPNVGGADYGPGGIVAFSYLATPTQDQFIVGDPSYPTLIDGSAVTVDSTLNVTGATDFDSTLNVDDNATFVKSLFVREQSADQADLAGDGQFWVEGKIPNSPRFTNDAGDIFTLNNVLEAAYAFDSATASADPGAGDIRFDNATPASVTNLYISDTDDTANDYSWILDNLATDDLLVIKSEADAADYLVAAVSAATTDNTGWWTIPVTIIHSGTLPRRFAG
jgi:hypothetical protein